MDSPAAPHTVTGWPGHPSPAHADRLPVAPAAILRPALGGAAVLIAVGLGAAACLSSLAPTSSTPTSASQITVAPSIGAPSTSTSSSAPSTPATRPTP